MNGRPVTRERMARTSLPVSVAPEVEALACEAAWVLEEANGDGPDVRDGDLRELSRRREWRGVDALRELLFAEVEVIHEVDGRQDRGAYADLGDVLFDLELAVEVRNACLSIGGPDRGEDEMDACNLGRIRGGDALLRLGLRACSEWRRHREEGGRSFERLRECGRVFERRADERDARVCEVPGLRGVGIPRHGANRVTAFEQALHHSATLVARGSRDDDDKLIAHDSRILSRSFQLVGVTVLGVDLLTLDCVGSASASERLRLL